MAWEPRGNRLYYYRKMRQGKRVISEYLGNDLPARLVSELDRRDRGQLLRKRTRWQAQKSEFKEMEADFEYLTEVVRGLVRAKLLTSGYHPHKGTWRKKRHV